jgi:hypothetical protein
MSEQSFTAGNYHNDYEFCGDCRGYLPYGSMWHFCEECKKVIGKCCVIKKINQDFTTYNFPEQAPKNNTFSSEKKTYLCINCDEKIKNKSKEVTTSEKNGNSDLFKQYNFKYVVMSPGYKFCPRCNNIKKCEHIGEQIFCSDCAKELF